MKARGAKLDPAVLAMGQMICGFVPLACYALAFEGYPTQMRWTTLALVCLLDLPLVGSVAAFLLYYWLVRNMDVTKTMLIALVTPLAAVLLGMFTLDEKLTWRVVAGGALIMSGVALVVLRRTRPVVKVEPEGATASAAAE